MRFLYDILFYFFALFYLPIFFMKGKHRGGWGSRFGNVPETVKSSLAGHDVFWVHAVSVGEVVQAAHFVQALRAKQPRARFVVTTTTLTGREVAERLLAKEVTLLYFPVDFRFAVKQFIKSIKPKAVIVLETEIWPNLVYELEARKIPFFIINGRISDKAIGGYRALRFFIKPILQKFKGIAVQDEGMKRRFLELGANPSALTVTGNMKFDWQPVDLKDETLEKLGCYIREAGGFWWVAGSTHEGEESLILDIYEKLRAQFPSLRLLMAPRHPERMAAVEDLINRGSEKALRVSSLASNVVEDSKFKPVLLLDRMGVLARAYSWADAVFVGGSLVHHGGHNLVEPAFYEKAILFGPFMENFKEMSEEFEKAGAAIKVNDPDALKAELSELIRNEMRKKELGGLAKRLLSRHEGATECNAQLILGSI